MCAQGVRAQEVLGGNLGGSDVVGHAASGNEAGSRRAGGGGRRIPSRESNHVQHGSGLASTPDTLVFKHPFTLGSVSTGQGGEQGDHTEPGSVDYLSGCRLYYGTQKSYFASFRFVTARKWTVVSPTGRPQRGRNGVSPIYRAIPELASLPGCEVSF
jgi:hypothetical protein